MAIKTWRDQELMKVSKPKLPLCLLSTKNKSYRKYSVLFWSSPNYTHPLPQHFKSKFASQKTEQRNPACLSLMHLSHYLHCYFWKIIWRGALHQTFPVNIWLLREQTTVCRDSLLFYSQSMVFSYTPVDLGVCRGFKSLLWHLPYKK